MGCACLPRHSHFLPSLLLPVCLNVFAATRNVANKTDISPPCATMVQACDLLAVCQGCWDAGKESEGCSPGDRVWSSS